MTILTHLLSKEIIHALGWTMVHSLWQGTLVGIFLYFILKTISVKKAHLRYEISSFALFTTLVTAIATFLFYIGYQSVPPIHGSEGILVGTHSQSISATSFQLNQFISDFSPYLVLIWFIGILIFCVRILGGYGYIIRLQSTEFPTANRSLQKILERLVKHTGLRRSVRMVESVAVKVPMTLGHLKPVILLPISLTTYLTPRQIEALIAHEFAHILRNDYLMNIFQTCVETVFYYHPAVWWMSGQIRQEREAACDDIAVQLTGDHLIYATALCSLKERNIEVPVLAMGATKKHTTLYNRICRILNQPIEKPKTTDRFIALGIVLSGLVLLSFTTQSGPVKLVYEDDNIFYESLEVSRIDVLHILDTIPGTTTLKHRIRRDTDAGKLELILEGNQVKEFIINGQKVDPVDFPRYAYEIQQIKEDLESLPPPPPPPPAPAPKEAMSAPDPPAPEVEIGLPELLEVPTPEEPESFPIPPKPLDVKQPALPPVPPLPPAPEIDKTKKIEKKQNRLDRDQEEIEPDNIAFIEKVIEIQITSEDGKTSDKAEYAVTAHYDASIKEEQAEHNVWINEDHNSSNFIEKTDEMHLNVRKVDRILKEKLEVDGMISDDQPFSFVLSPDILRINGKKQSQHLHEAYKKWWEASAGVRMPARFKLEIKQQ